MRPFALTPVFARLNSLSGVGDKICVAYQKLLGGEKIIDLLHHMPVDFVNRQMVESLPQTITGRVATIRVKIQHFWPSQKRGQPLRIECVDQTNVHRIDLVFFHGHPQMWQSKLPVGHYVTISGLVEKYRDTWQMAHPDWMVLDGDDMDIPKLEPIYPLSAGISHRVLLKHIDQALQICPDLPEWHDPALLKKYKWQSWKDSLLHAHHMQSEKDTSPQSPHRQRLAYDELLASQLAVAMIRHHQRNNKGRVTCGDGHFRKALLSKIPFDLTGAQIRALDEIYADMKQPNRMVRLLQGDVGSGKTIVAALSMAAAVEMGYQCAIMAPTEILARQHAAGLIPLFDSIGIKVVVLTGKDKTKAKNEILNQIEQGDAKIIIGTHALFQEKVIFQNLGYVVVDEQHRFGVHQRLALSEKGRGTDLLVMTATPIPRTLTLTAYGDMDVSRLDEKPAGRKPIDTRLLPLEKLPSMIHSVGRAMQQGNQIYWVCPLVEESEKLDLAAAEDRFETLQQHYGDLVGLVHGRLKNDEKEHTMQRFIAGEIKILVATTVIEVGVNVPQATIMVIEHAERFGLAQLHQLRGRVGRGSDASFCFLLYGLPLNDTAKERLQTLRDSEDGFYIAEKDLQLRGGGEILGTKQSGLPSFKLAMLDEHADLLTMARDDARLIIHNNPDLQSERGAALRHLLYLFERDQAVGLLRAG